MLRDYLQESRRSGNRISIEAQPPSPEQRGGNILNKPDHIPAKVGRIEDTTRKRGALRAPFPQTPPRSFLSIEHMTECNFLLLFRFNAPLAI